MEDWAEAGRGWGARAVEWAYLCEPYARPANELLFDRLGVGEGVRHIDIACGSGFAAHLAAERNARVSGLDAAEALVAIARVRTPNGDFRVGDMFELPFEDNSFDVATSFNGIWKGCEGALSEARRVLVPAGRLGLTFWGRYDRLGLMTYFLRMIELSPSGHGTASMEQGDTGRRGVVEDMLARRDSNWSSVGRLMSSTNGLMSKRRSAHWGPRDRLSPRSRPSATKRSVRRCERSYRRCGTGRSASGSHPSSGGPRRRPRDPCAHWAQRVPTYA